MSPFEAHSPLDNAIDSGIRTIGRGFELIAYSTLYAAGILLLLVCLPFWILGIVAHRLGWVE